MLKLIDHRIITSTAWTDDQKLLKKLNITVCRGVHPPLRPWCIFPLFQISPIVFDKFSDSVENFQNFTFSRKIFRFSFAKISDDLFFPSCFAKIIISPYFHKFPPCFLKIHLLFTCFLCISFSLLLLYFKSIGNSYMWHTLCGHCRCLLLGGHAHPQHRGNIGRVMCKLDDCRCLNVAYNFRSAQRLKGSTGNFVSRCQTIEFLMLLIMFRKRLTSMRSGRRSKAGKEKSTLQRLVQPLLTSHSLQLA